MNCRGVSKKGFSFSLGDLLFNNQVDVVGLQETMKKTMDRYVWRKFDPDNTYEWLWAPSVGRSGGFCVALNPPDLMLLIL